MTHSADTNLLGDIVGCVNVHLVEVGVGGVFRYFLKNGRDDSAGATPSCPEVKDGHPVPMDL
jgi:hypothetical protein